MSFELIEDNTYEWPVTLKIPRNGKYVTHKFTGVFNVLEQPEINAALEGGDEDDKRNQDERLLDAVLAGWSGFKDAKGELIEYEDGNRAQCIATPGIRLGMLMAYRESVEGGLPKQKNL